MLVDRCAWLRLHVQLFDEKVAETGHALSDRDRRSYLAFSNSLTRLLGQLGLEARVANKTPTLDEHLAALAARQGDAAA
jgi:hypothetical protein